MIISASRRTDIPAFYAQWFINRIRAGYCAVPNPFNPQRVARLSLEPQDVDVIVFWTRNPRPLFPHLAELQARGFRYYFQYTLMDNPRLLDPKAPGVDAAIDSFRELAQRVGPQRVIWRFDPIVLTEITTTDFHRERYARKGARLLDYDGREGWFSQLVCELVAIAGANGMQIFSCAEELDLNRFGVRPGKCVDVEYITEVFGLEVSHSKDPGQRAACGCVVSKDVGMYDSCTFGCQYCYAVSSFARARANQAQHDPRSPSLLGWYGADEAQ